MPMPTLLLALLLALPPGVLPPGPSPPDPSPPVYEARRIRTPPRIDGDLSDPAWAEAPWTEAFQDIRGDERPPPPHATRVKVL